mgnify:CR=1 FL=1|jgi:hypothetical protein
MYQVSYIVGDESSPGLIRSQENKPCVGCLTTLYNRTFRIREVVQLPIERDDKVYILAMVDEVPPNTEQPA